MTSRLRQTAYVTTLDRFDATLQYWTDAFGAGPFYVFDIELGEPTWRGEPCRTRMRVAMTMLGEGQVEIIAPFASESGEDEAKVYTEWMAQRGPIPVGGLFHHFRVDTEDFDATYDAIIASGAREGLTATAPGGRPVAYIDGAATVGSFIEVMKQNPDTLRLMDRMREVCDSWDGEQPVREYAAFIQETLGSTIAGYAPASK